MTPQSAARVSGENTGTVETGRLQRAGLLVETAAKETLIVVLAPTASEPAPVMSFQVKVPDPTVSGEGVADE